MARHVGEGGAFLIVILLSLVIMCYLVLGYFQKGVTAGGQISQSTVDASMEMARNAQCLANQQRFAIELMRWSTIHPGTPPTVENLRQSIPPVAIPKCLSGGTIIISDDGQIYCSIHNPEPTPEPTPTPAPAIDLTGSATDPDIVTPQPAEESAE